MLTRRPITSEDKAFLQRVYASTREEELALVDWTGAQKAAFLQFEAQHSYYVAQFKKAAFDLIFLNGEPIGRLAAAEGDSGPSAGRRPPGAHSRRAL